MRIFSVTGSFTAFTVARISCVASGRSRINDDPAWPLTTFFTGQPMLMSMIAAPFCSLSLAASAMRSGSQPANCMETGSSHGCQAAFWMLCRVSRIIASDAIISVTVKPAPNRLTSVRNGMSVTPVIGARITGTSMRLGPIWMGAIRLIARGP